MANEFKIKVGAITPNIQVTDNTASTSTTTGALIVTGGAGIGGNLNVGGDLDVTGSFNIGNINDSVIGNITPREAFFTNLSATGTVTFNTATNNQVYSTTGAGTISITSATEGSMNGIRIGQSNPREGSFTALTATGSITANTTTNNQSYTTTGTSTITISSGGVGSIANMTIGATGTPRSGAFSTVTANANTTSTTTGTGTVVVTGGVGISENINAGGIAGIGAPVQTGVRLTVAAQTTTVAPPTNTNLHVYSANSNQSRIVNDTFGTGVYPSFMSRVARGTAAAPTAVQANDVLGRFGAAGYGSTAYSAETRARIEITASQAWTDTAHGTGMDFYTTPNNTIVPVRQVGIDQTGIVTIYDTTNSTDGTNGALVVNGGLGVVQDLRVNGEIFISNVKVQQIGQIITTSQGWNLA